MTGSNGYVGGAVTRAATAFPHMALVPVRRDETPDFATAPGGIVSFLHLGWPNFPAASASSTARLEQSWDEFLNHTMKLRAHAAKNGVRFVGVGSGLELHEGAGMQEPYLSYARRKNQLKAALAAAHGPLSWVRLHFMFGPKERASRVVPAAINACEAGSLMTCGSLARQRRWLDIDDQAMFLLEFLAAPQSGEWDIAGQSDISFRRLLELVEMAVGRPMRFAEAKDRTPDDIVATIRPARMAPNVPVAAGSEDYLVDRLRRYASSLRDDRRRTAASTHEREG